MLQLELLCFQLNSNKKLTLSNMNKEVLRDPIE